MSFLPNRQGATALIRQTRLVWGNQPLKLVEGHVDHHFPAQSSIRILAEFAASVFTSCSIRPTIPAKSPARIRTESPTRNAPRVASKPPRAVLANSGAIGLRSL